VADVSEVVLLAAENVNVAASFVEVVVGNTNLA
jgi:hypothetical protein